MRKGMIRLGLGVVGLLAVAGWSYSASASPVVTQPLAVGEKTTQVQQLQQAYHILEVADHDYKGHRKKAMGHIERACKELGAKPHGDGKGKEPQGTSDAQLREAQSMLQQARATASANNLKQVVKHIDNALEEINTALKIK